MSAIIFVRFLSGLPFSAENFCDMPITPKDFLFSTVIPLEAYFTGNEFDLKKCQLFSICTAQITFFWPDGVKKNNPSDTSSYTNLPMN
jgi:hypothetical protein